MRKKLILLLIFFVPVLPQFLNADNGTTALQFLLENLNARQMGMGGIFASTAQNAEALSTNPAGLIAKQCPEINFSYVGAHADGSFTSTQMSAPYWKGEHLSVGVGGGFMYYSAGNIDINYSNGTTYSFDAEKSFSAAGGISLQIGDSFSIGVAPKYISSLLVEQYLAKGWAIDSGLLWMPFPTLLQRRLTLGATVQNLGFPVRYKSQTHALPRTDSAGASIELWNRKGYDSLLLAGQIERTLGETARGRLGIEIGFGGDEEKILTVRGGYLLHFEDRDYTLGLGIREKNLRLDYAYVNGIELGTTHRVTFTLRFGKKEAVVEEQLKHELLDPKKGFKTEEESDKKMKAEMEKSLNKKTQGYTIETGE